MATSAFGKAFRAAREAGDTEFEFGGKKYNTKMKDEDSGSTKSSTSARPASTETRAEPKQSGTPDLPVTKANTSSDASAPKKEYYRNMSGKMVEKTPTPAADEDSGFLGKRMREAMGSSYKKGGSVRSSASSRADGIAKRGKTKGRIC